LPEIKHFGPPKIFAPQKIFGLATPLAERGPLANTQKKT